MHPLYGDENLELIFLLTSVPLFISKYACFPETIIAKFKNIFGFSIYYPETKSVNFHVLKYLISNSEKNVMKIGTKIWYIN